MDTIYALTIIFTGILLPTADSSPDLISGEVVNKTTVYFRTLEACELAHEKALENQDQISPSEMEVTVEIKPCEGIQVAE